MRIGFFLLIIICVTGFGFTDEPDDLDEFSRTGRGGDPVLIFGTILVVVALFYLLRYLTRKMKTEKKTIEEQDN